jgi:hypothetical protein
MSWVEIERWISAYLWHGEGKHVRIENMERAETWQLVASEPQSHDCRMLACVGNGQRHSATVFNRCVLEVSYTSLYVQDYSRVCTCLHLFALGLHFAGVCVCWRVAGCWPALA